MGNYHLLPFNLLNHILVFPFILPNFLWLIVLFAFLYSGNASCICLSITLTITMSSYPLFLRNLLYKYCLLKWPLELLGTVGESWWAHKPVVYARLTLVQGVSNNKQHKFNDFFILLYYFFIIVFHFSYIPYI